LGFGFYSSNFEFVSDFGFRVSDLSPGEAMSLTTVLNLILHNERLTRGLEDAEARMLIEWLVERAETEHGDAASEQEVRDVTLRRCQRARAIARFVALWCHDRSYGAALQLAATERFTWPLPTEPMDPCDLMNEILTFESTIDDDR
jgi:hypothetical protein